MSHDIQREGHTHNTLHTEARYMFTTSVSYVTLSKTLSRELEADRKCCGLRITSVVTKLFLAERGGGGEERVPECWTGSLPKMVNCRFVVTSQHPLETRSFHGNVNVRPNIGWVDDDITSSGGKRLSQTCLCLRGQVCVCVGGRGRVVASSTPCDLMVVLTSAGQSSVGYHRCVNTLSSKTHSVAQLAPRSRADRPRTAGSDPETSS